MSDQPLDQTSFIESAELRDEPRTSTSKSQDATQNTSTSTLSPRPPKKQIPAKILILIGLGIFSFVLLFLLMILSLSKAKPSTLTTQPTPTALPVIGATIPADLQKSIDTLNSDIKDADPQSNDLPFPPVNFQLHLIPPPLTTSR